MTRIDDTPIASSTRGSWMHRIRQEGAHELSIVPGNLILIFAIVFLIAGIAIGLFGDRIPLFSKDRFARETIGISFHAFTTFGVFLNTALIFGIHFWFQRQGVHVHCNLNARSIEMTSRHRNINRHFSFSEIEAIQLCLRKGGGENDGIQLILVLKGDAPERLLVVDAHPFRRVSEAGNALARF